MQSKSTLLSDGFSLHRYFHTVQVNYKPSAKQFQAIGFSVACCVFLGFQTLSHSCSSTANLSQFFHILLHYGHQIRMSRNSFVLPRDNPTSCSNCIFPSKQARLAAALYQELLCSWMIPATVIPETFSERLLSERQPLLLRRWLTHFVPSSMTLDLSPLKRILFGRTKRWLCKLWGTNPIMHGYIESCFTWKLFSTIFQNNRQTNHFKPINNLCGCTRSSSLYSENFQLVNKT